VPSQTAIDYPLKELIYPTAKDQKAYLVIGRELNGVAAPAQIKWISNANGLDRTTKYEYINSTAAETGSSSIFGVANLPEVITVGAADQNQDFSSNLATVREYSSRNSSEIIFDDSGDLLFDQEPRIKPDIIAPDGVSTSVAGFENFQGTSAAAPHIAGIIALMEQAAGGAEALSPQQILEILQDTATPLSFQQATGNSLLGLAQADAAVARSQIIAENLSVFTCSEW
jgi:subtilisin family serine protease